MHLTFFFLQNFSHAFSIFFFFFVLGKLFRVYTKKLIFHPRCVVQKFSTSIAFFSAPLFLYQLTSNIDHRFFSTADTNIIRVVSLITCASHIPKKSIKNSFDLRRSVSTSRVHNFCVKQSSRNALKQCSTPVFQF